jgi:hypothetical protein
VLRSELLLARDHSDVARCTRHLNARMHDRFRRERYHAKRVSAVRGMHVSACSNGAST